jgi:hypothetical protein
MIAESWRRNWEQIPFYSFAPEVVFSLSAAPLNSPSIFSTR